MPHPVRTTRFAWLAVPPAIVLATAAWLVLSLPTRATVLPTAALPTTVPPTTVPPATVPPATVPPATGTTAPPPAGPSRAPAAAPPTTAGGIALSARARAQCPPAASACADLTAHLTWLQSGGRITYGPAPMEPGGPGDPTPRGIFRVAWKAGARYISTSYGVPIPYAVFFAPGGIAFHQGSLTTSSHGCIHLTMAAARFYNEHLPVGAEVAVF